MATPIPNDAFYTGGNDFNIAEAPDLLTAIAMFYEKKGAFTQKAIQGQLNEMKGDQHKMEMINEALAYLRAANSASDNDTFKVSAATYKTLVDGAGGCRAPNQQANTTLFVETDAAGNAISYTVKFDKADDNESKKNQANIDTFKSKLDTMNNTSQLKMLSLNKYMDNLSTITSTAANGQKAVGDMNQGIAQKM
jgi:hypothetical protein